MRPTSSINLAQNDAVGPANNEQAALELLVLLNSSTFLIVLSVLLMHYFSSL